MADKVDKPKKKVKAKKDEKGVLAALPSTRPERIGTRRAATARKTTTAKAASKTAAKSPATKRPAAAKRSKASATAKASSASVATKKPAGPRATAARRKAAAPRTFEPTHAAESAAGAADERAAGAVPLAETPPKPSSERTYPRPRPVSAGAPGIGTAGYRDQSPESARPSGVELATTAVKAAGEVAQLGFTITGHVLKRVVGRLPKP